MSETNEHCTYRLSAQDEKLHRISEHVKHGENYTSKVQKCCTLECLPSQFKQQRQDFNLGRTPCARREILWRKWKKLLRNKVWASTRNGNPTAVVFDTQQYVVLLAFDKPALVCFRFYCSVPSYHGGFVALRGWIPGEAPIL